MLWNLRIPWKAIGNPADSDQGSGRSDGGGVIVAELVGIIKLNTTKWGYSGAKRMFGVSAGSGCKARGSAPLALP